MNFKDLTSIDELKEFLSGVKRVVFKIDETKDARYSWVNKFLVQFRYGQLSKAEKGIVIKCIIKLTGYSRQQVTRLIQQHARTGHIRRQQQTVKGFTPKYTREDIVLLAKMDQLHDTPSGPALKKLCERAWKLFGDSQYEKLGQISVSHLYNLRKTFTYTKKRQHFQKTRPNRSPIGERRKPRPNGKPGYLRIDTVHQGDLDGKKGVYHINAVDEVTQFEIVVTVEKISEYYLLPALEQLLEAFPFEILGFHSDNGSEYVNKYVAKLLSKLLVEFTKSRARHCNDNALAECKNGAVVRKFLGHSHISQKWASLTNLFNQQHLNPYINYHRPCYFPEEKIDNKGKIRKFYYYKNLLTPYEKLKSLPAAEKYLKPGVTFKELDKIAYIRSDNDAASSLQIARDKLFKTIYERTRRTG
ncbi:MAG: transposase family protein [Pseudomonadota bacterium]